MNKRQRKKMAQKPANVLRPWAGRFSRSPEERGEEVLVVYVARPCLNNQEQETTEELVTPYGDDAGSVIAHCKQLVDLFLAETHRPGMTPDELYSRYRQEGPDPYIRYEERGVSEYFTNSMSVAFNAWGYAECACRTLCGEEPGEPSRSLACWQGRYREYDRTRMMSQLLLWRRVRLTRECSGIIGTFPAGTEGVIGIHDHCIDASTFDWRVEVPVIFDVADERSQVTFGIPYDALEFVESDEEYMQSMRKYRP
jgi:hypothetical protein